MPDLSSLGERFAILIWAKNQCLKKELVETEVENFCQTFQAGISWAMSIIILLYSI